jgi:energy-coupling factor transporter ATP-binding protein EcfA2
MSDRSDARDTRPDLGVLGVTLLGPAPIGEIHLQLARGRVCAMYGLNGAGKTAVLRGLEEAFRGLRNGGGTSILHVHVNWVDDRPCGPTDPEWIRTLNEALETAAYSRLAELSSVYPEHEADILLWDEWEVYVRRASSNPRVWATALAWMWYRDWGLADRVGSQGLFSLTTVGRETPEWRISVAFRPSETPTRTTPQTRVPREGQRLTYETLGLPAWGSRSPAWTPVPLTDAGVLQDADVVPLLVTDGLDDDALDQAMAGLLTDLEGDLLVSEKGDVRVAPLVQQLIDSLSERATWLSSTLLEDAPRLECRIAQPNHWISERPTVWEAFDQPSQTWVRASRLSQAQRRWSRIAGWTAIGELGSKLDDRSIGCVAIDEPEAALHPRAQRKVLSGLKRLATEQDCAVVIATHAPAVLNDSDIALYHVRRGRKGLAEALPMESGDRGELDAGKLGISPADLLQTIRTFVVVEGAHDLAVLEETLGAELERSRAIVVAMRGVARSLSVVDSRVILDFTEGNIVIVLDGTSVGEVGELSRRWKRSRRLALGGDSAEAVRALGPPASWGKGEGATLYEICRRAVSASQRVNRVRLFMMSQPDVIQYLPATEFVSGAAGWDALRHEWDSYRDAGGRDDFKRWLRNAKQANISTQRIRTLARQLDEIHEDFQKLLQLLR